MTNKPFLIFVGLLFATIPILANDVDHLEPMSEEDMRFKMQMHQLEHISNPSGNWQTELMVYAVPSFSPAVFIAFQKLPKEATEESYYARCVLIVLDDISYNSEGDIKEHLLAFAMKVKAVRDEQYKEVETLWEQMMLRTQSYEQPYRGLDGNEFYFIYSKAARSMTGKVWSPDEGKPYALLLLLDKLMVKYFSIEHVFSLASGSEGSDD